MYDIPVLSASDFCKDVPRNDSGQRCLVIWCDSLSPRPVWDEERYSAMMVMEQVLWDLATSRGYRDIASFNDDPLNSLSDIADLWNEAREKALERLEREAPDEQLH